MTLDEMLVREAKKYLDGFHINLTKYTAEVTHYEVTAVICFTSTETKQSIYVDDCYFTDSEILQAELHF